MKNSLQIRKLTTTAMLAAVAAVLAFLNFNVPLMPSFIKFDFSELPAVIATFAFGPLSGIAVCLIKNLINLMFTSTFGVGDLSNFILGCAFVLPLGLVYKYNKTRKGAVIAALIGALSMAIISVFSNYFLIYPLYGAVLNWPMDRILGAYQAINSSVSSLWDALIWFNMPFTFLKALSSVIITFFIYKPLSPILKGHRDKI